MKNRMKNREVTHATGLGSGIATPARMSVLAAALMMAIPAFAQQAPHKHDDDDSEWGVGLAVMSEQKAYTGVDRKSSVLPLITYENSYVKLMGPNLELKLPSVQLSPSQRLNFGVVSKLFDDSGYKASDSAALTGMTDRKSSIWLGAKMEWENEIANVQLGWLGDASSHSKGQRIALGVSRRFTVSPNIMLIPQVGLEWTDKKFVDYYYGVNPNETTSGRAAYTGKSTVSPEMSLTGIYRFDQHHSMLLNVGMQSLGSGIKNSSIVDRSTTNRVMLGYKYSF